MKRLLTLIPFLILLTVSAFAQDALEPVALLEYYDDEFEIEVYDIDGNMVEGVFYGMELMPGDRIKTLASSAEIRLDPNGSIVKLSENTEFIIEALQRDEQTANEFSLLGGKIRTVAAKIGVFQHNNYSIQTPSAVAGVRGTDFGLEVVPSLSDAAFVFEGAIEYTSLNTGKAVSLGAGQFADALGSSFEAVTLSTERLATLYENLQFTNLNPEEVPGYVAPVVKEEKKAPEPVQEESQAITEEVPPKDSAVMNFLAQYMGMEIGTVTIDGITYSKLILQPTFNVGKFGVSLYLPVIYNTNLFDPNDWYRPNNNYEWSFGTDQNNIQDGTKDAIRDLVLKIRYIEYGDNRDTVFFKVGNYDDVTMGHGILMNRFANDTDFPAIRRVGINGGVNTSKWTLESVVNDLAEPEIMGARIGYRPLGSVFPLGFGVSSIMDLNPDTDNAYGDPIILNPALDTEFPLVDNDSLSIVAYADIATTVPYFRDSYLTVDSGWATDYFYNTDGNNFLDSLQNYGWNTGVLGNIGIMNYKLEYQFSKGLFFNGQYGPTYERTRDLYASAAAYNVWSDYTDSSEVLQGIYGEAGFEIPNILLMEAGYRMAWDDSGLNGEADLFHLQLTVPTIPFIGLSAGLGMDTVGFADDIIHHTLFDEGTALYGELVYPIAPTLKLAAVLTNFVNADGDANFAVSIETRVAF